jgi:hypothetical protein
MDDLSPNFRRGDVLTADVINALIEATGIDIRGGAGVQARKTRRGVQLTAIQPNTAYLAKATSNFAVRSSTTPGSGTLDLYWIDTAGPTIATLGISVTAYTVTSKAQTSGNAINSGQYCWAEQDPFGVWHTMPLECT